MASGRLTDRFDSRALLGGYYALRGLSLLVLPSLTAASAHPSMLGFGWVFASHQLGAAIAATGAGVIRDINGDYNIAWIAAGILCLFAAVLSVRIKRHRLRVG